MSLAYAKWPHAGVRPSRSICCWLIVNWYSHIHFSSFSKPRTENWKANSKSLLHYYILYICKCLNIQAQNTFLMSLAYTEQPPGWGYHILSVANWLLIDICTYTLVLSANHVQRTNELSWASKLAMHVQRKALWYMPSWKSAETPFSPFQGKWYITEASNVHAIQ